MTKQDKLLVRFLTKPRNFRFDEMKKLLQGFGYQESKQGKTSGSRIAFINKTTNHIIRIHKPHPAKTMKRYQMDLIEEELRKLELLK